MVVDVEADDHEDAISEALSQAASIPEKEWTGTFDPDSYTYDAQYVEEVGDPNDEDQEVDDDYIFSGVSEDRKYLLLKADTDSGEGDVLFQPWTTKITDLMVADLCMDWCGELEETRDEGASKFYEQLVEQHQRQQRKPAKVCQFRRPTDGKENK